MENETKFEPRQLYTAALILYGTGISWFVASLVRLSNGKDGTWGNCLLAGIGIGCGSALAYYAAVARKTKYPLRWIRLLTVAIAVVSSASIAWATAVIVGVV